MKKLKIFSITTVLMVVSIAFRPAEKITEGKASYAITFVDLTPEMKQTEAMLPKKMTMYFKGHNFRSEMPTSFGNTITIYNATKKEFYLLMDMMGQKSALVQTELEMDETRKTAPVKNLHVKKLEETKKIAGYMCKKAEISFEMDGITEKVDCFYTTELPAVGNQNTSPGFDQIEGFMMEYSLNLQGVKMKMVVEEINAQTINADYFVIPKGFTVKSRKELVGED